MLEQIADYFYDPFVFWTAPLALVVLAAGWRKLRAWWLRRVRARALPPDKDQ